MLSLDHILANENHVHIHSAICIVRGGKERYIIYGFFDDSVDVNFNLLEIRPSSPWRGELIIFSLGKRVRLRSRPSGSKASLERAIERYVWYLQSQVTTDYIGYNDSYIEGCTAARALGQALPSQIIVRI